MGRLLLAIAFIAFISLGLPDGLLGVAWPSMRASFGVSLDAMGALLAALVAGYVLSTTFSGALVARLGIGRLLAASSTLTAVALIGYTLAPAWPLVLALGVLAGIGGGAIDAGINNYIAYRQRSQLYLLHAMFGVGTTIGPLIMTAALNVATWRAGYLLVGGFQLVLAFTFLLTAERWRMDGEEETKEAEETTGATLGQTLRLPMAWGGILFFLFYTGIEVSVGQWSYTLFTAGREVPENVAGIVVGAYWGAFTVGRLLSGWIARRVRETTFLRASFGLVIGGTLLVWWNPATAVSLIALPLTGFGLAPLFPALVGSTADRVAARHRANTIGFQIGAAAVGGAVLPGLAGALTRLFGLEAITAVHLIAALLLALLHEILLWGTRRRRGERKR
jgi:fucose permease